MSETYIGTTERAAIIRAALKAKKWSSRDVSVKADHFSMGSAIRIKIKNPAVPLAAVREIASAHESISRDPGTGEILSGGNRYLDIGYSSEARQVLAAQHLPAIEAAAEELAKHKSDNVLIPVAGHAGFLLGRGRHGHGFAIWKEGGHDAECSDAMSAALVLGMGGSRS